MIAVRLTPNFGWCVLGSDHYFETHGKPRQPEDLMRHQCIGYRFPSAKTVARWQFHRKGRSFSVDAASDLIVNDHLTMISLATAGLGLVYTADLIAARELEAGCLKAILQPFCRSTQGLYLYFPARSQTQPKLRAFIDFATKAARKERSRAP
jgi:DNA-binding transcriptional LysR family regulator